MPHDLYILGKRVFLTYLNQEVQCWYDTIIWILVPCSHSVCPYSVPFGGFPSNPGSHMALSSQVLLVSFDLEQFLSTSFHVYEIDILSVG